ncbi:MAG TPA: ATP-binding protein [Solirubrobacteraceae bacterium]
MNVVLPHAGTRIRPLRVCREEEGPLEPGFRHEVILRGDGADGFVSQMAPEETSLPFDGRLRSAPPEAQAVNFDEAGLASLRRAVTVWADEHDLRRASIEELVLAVDEIATNSIRYGGGEGTLQMWRERDVLLCEVSDRGHITDPLLGRMQPSPDSLSGRGMWIVKHLCDLVQIRSSPAGSQVRMHKKLA